MHHLRVQHALTERCAAVCYRESQMNKLALVAAPIAILAAVACALPWYVGVQVERSVREEVSRFADSPWLPS